MMKRLLIAILCLASYRQAAASGGRDARCDSVVQEAWKIWERNDHSEVRRILTQALSIDPKSARAHLALAFLYELERNEVDAWNEVRAIQNNDSSYYPMLFAAWGLLPSSVAGRKPALDISTRIMSHPDPTGTLRGMACEKAGEVYQLKKDLAKSRAAFGEIKSIDDWMLIGPFENISASGFDRKFAPEEPYDPSLATAGKNGVPVRWFRIPAMRPDHWIDFTRYFIARDAIFYANVFVYSPKRQPAQLRIGTSGSLKAFLNDDQVVEYFDENNNDLDTYIVETDLQEGWNRLLVKCGYSDIDRCNFMARLTDSRGERIPRIKFSTEPKPYKIHPGSPVAVIENFAEHYLREQIHAHPEEFENYVLLAKAYLRNDKSVEAELVLRDAIAKLSGCALFPYYLIEAYGRGRKNDERISTEDKVYELDKSVPFVLFSKAEAAITQERYDEAGKLVDALKSCAPRSETYYLASLDLAVRKRSEEEARALAEEAYTRHPDSWEFATIKASLAGRYDPRKAIGIYEKALTLNYTPGNLVQTGNAYLRTGDVLNWEKSFARAVSLDPSEPDYMRQMGQVHKSLKKFEAAESDFRKAASICPSDWRNSEMIGDIYKSKSKNELAKDLYRKSLSLMPTNYNAREALRELEGKKSVFEDFPDYSIDSLIKSASDLTSTSGDETVILLEDTRRVVYDHGGSELEQTDVIKLLTSRSVELFKERRIEHNPYSEQLVVEEASTVKKDGTRIKADIEDNHVVFKSAEPNDCLLLRWRLKDYHNGRLLAKFWDTRNFNAFLPSKIVRYALLAPDSLKFSYHTRNWNAEPEKRQTMDGTLYTWVSRDEPAIRYEAGMPGLDDAGKILYISNVDDWKFIVDWYTDLARTKTRSSFEIKEQIAKLLAGKTNLTDDEKISAVYDFVTEQIQYSFVPFRQSGLVPQMARNVLTSRLGDCKDKATLAISMLTELGLEAHYVLVQTRDEGQRLESLPSISFNHCIVGVTRADGVQYLDFTAKGYPPGSLPLLDVEAFALPITMTTSQPVLIERKYTQPGIVGREGSIELRQDGGMKVSVRSMKSGAEGAMFRGVYREKSKEQADKTFTELMSRDYHSFRLLDFDLGALDQAGQVVRYSYAYDVGNYVSESGTLRFFNIPWDDGLKPMEALSYEQRVYRFSLYFPDSTTEEFTVSLPPGFRVQELPKAASYSSPVADYGVSYTLTGNSLKARRYFIVKKFEIAPEEYNEYRSFYANVVKEDARQIVFTAK